MTNLTNCTGSGAAAVLDPLSLCNPDGFLPCSSSIFGNFLLIIIYGTLLGVGAKWISEGSERLQEIWGAGIVGGLLLPVLGAGPDALVIGMSVMLSTDPATLQDDLNVGMGTLVGSNVVLLTIPWALSLWLGNVPMVGNPLTAQYELEDGEEQTDNKTAERVLTTTSTTATTTTVDIELTKTKETKETKESNTTSPPSSVETANAKACSRSLTGDALQDTHDALDTAKQPKKIFRRSTLDALLSKNTKG